MLCLHTVKDPYVHVRTKSVTTGSAQCLPFGDMPGYAIWFKPFQAWRGGTGERKSWRMGAWTHLNSIDEQFWSFCPLDARYHLFVWIDTDVDFYILYGYQASWGPIIREPWPGSSVVCHSDGGARVKQSVNKSKGTVTMVTILVSSNVVWWCNAWHII